MPRRKVALIACAAALACLGFVLSLRPTAPNLRARFETPLVNSDWFALRDAVVGAPAGTETPAIMRAWVALTFRQDGDAIRYAQQAMRSSRGSDIGDAHEILSDIYDREGRYREALEEALAARAARKQGADADPLEHQEMLWKAIGSWPAPALLASKPSRLHGSHDDDGIELPVAINGKRASYLLDTGTTTSTITPEEAARQGLDVLPIPGYVVSDANDDDVPASAALVKELTIGGFRMSNVLFLVEKDDSGGDGIIGMNVLEMLQTVRWTDDGQIEIGFPSSDFDLVAANLCLEGPESPLVSARYGGKQIQVYFDSGGDDTEFLRRFDEEFPDVKRTGKPTEISTHGAGGTRKWRGVTMPQVAIEIGGTTVSIVDETLLTDERPDFHTSAHVWLGLDALSKAPHISLDFRAMRFSLQ